MDWETFCERVRETEEEIEQLAPQFSNHSYYKEDMRIPKSVAKFYRDRRHAKFPHLHFVDKE